MPKVTRKFIDKDLENKFKQMISKVEQKIDKTAYAIWPEFQNTHVNKLIKYGIEVNNPAFLSDAVRFYKIDEYGSNIDKDVFDPHKLANSENDFYEGNAHRQMKQFQSKDTKQEAIFSGIIPSNAN